MARAICRFRRADASPASNRQPPTLLKNQQFSFAEGGPRFVGSERTGHDHCHLIVLASLFRKVQLKVFVTQMRGAKGVAALDVVEVGGGVCPQGLAVGKQEIECAVGCYARSEFLER